MNQTNIHGGCLCGNVRYEIRGTLKRNVVNCHCDMCRRLHGGFGAHTKANKHDIHITNSTGLAWYESSSIARRGFCRLCGSSLFWEPVGQNTTGIVAGSLDTFDGLKTIGHIFVDEKASFYEITDNCPQFKKSSNGMLPDDFC